MEAVEAFGSESQGKAKCSKESVETMKTDYQDDHHDDYLKLEDGEYIEDEQEMSMDQFCGLT